MIISAMVVPGTLVFTPLFGPSTFGPAPWIAYTGVAAAGLLGWLYRRRLFLKAAP